MTKVIRDWPPVIEDLDCPGHFFFNLVKLRTAAHLFNEEFERQLRLISSGDPIVDVNSYGVIDDDERKSR